MIENPTHRMIRTRGLPQTLTYATALGVACLVSFEITTHLLARVHPVSEADDELGGMWATIATLFVFRVAHQQSVAAALSRTRATVVSFALCLLYLAFLPFHPWGMVLLIWVGAVLVTSTGHPEDVVTTGITTVVVMVLAALSPHDAWQQPILRLADTVVGIGIGVAAAALHRASTPTPHRLAR
ncbi:MAG TPA: FUSC family protein [Solirubrobacteraceae bacterium]